MNNSKMYLVTFRGVPDWEGEECNSYCERKYLFDSPHKASKFVRNRTKDIEWETHPACMEGSMGHRIKKGEFHCEDGSTFRNEYITVALDVNEECAPECPNGEQATHKFVDEVENSLRLVEAELETIGRFICPVRASGSSWNSINNALENVRDAIHNSFLMRPADRQEGD